MLPGAVPSDSPGAAQSWARGARLEASAAHSSYSDAPQMVHDAELDDLGQPAANGLRRPDGPSASMTLPNNSSRRNISGGGPAAIARTMDAMDLGLPDDRSQSHHSRAGGAAAAPAGAWFPSAPHVASSGASTEASSAHQGGGPITSVKRRPQHGGQDEAAADDDEAAMGHAVLAEAALRAGGGSPPPAALSPSAHHFQQTASSHSSQQHSQQASLHSPGGFLGRHSARVAPFSPQEAGGQGYGDSGQAGSAGSSPGLGPASHGGLQYEEGSHGGSDGGYDDGGGPGDGADGRHHLHHMHRGGDGNGSDGGGDLGDGPMPNEEEDQGAMMDPVDEGLTNPASRRIKWSDEHGYDLYEVFYSDKLHYSEGGLTEEEARSGSCCVVM